MVIYPTHPSTALLLRQLELLAVLGEAPTDDPLECDNRQRAKLHLHNVEAALHRLETGQYGICLACGQPIAQERLTIKPEAPLCVTCQRRAELEQVAW